MKSDYLVSKKQVLDGPLVFTVLSEKLSLLFDEQGDFLVDQVLQQTCDVFSLDLQVVLCNESLLLVFASLVTH